MHGHNGRVRRDSRPLRFSARLASALIRGQICSVYLYATAQPPPPAMFSFKDKGVKGYEGFFLALTFVVMLVILVSSKDMTTALLTIGLITNFLIISSQLTMIGDRNIKMDAAAAVAPPSAAALISASQSNFHDPEFDSVADGAYPGAIDVPEDRTLRSPVGDSALLDGDERITHQVRSRNDPERVWAGALQKKAFIEPYVAEELADAEDRPWWGRHEH